VDYDRNKKYFEEKNLKGAIITLIIGVIICLAGLGGKDSAGVVIVGLIIGGIGGFLIYSKTAGRMTDDEIDQICQDAIKDVKVRALKKHGLDEDQVKEADPIIFDGYYYKNIRSGCLFQEGKDNVWRSSTYEAVVFFFSAEQVYCYEYRFSIVADEKQEATEEYFYRDIVSAATASDTVTYKMKDGKEQSINYEKFKLTTSGGTSISASVLNMSNADRSINAMKSLLRNKKSSK